MELFFIDDNNNGIWDLGEELLTGVPVNLYMGSVIHSTTFTDNGGYYIFDPVTISNPRIEIDTTGLGLNLSGGTLEDDVDFVDCIEDKEKNFPLIRECTNSNENLDLYTCPGETVMVNSVILQEGDTLTFDDINASGCDSVTFVTVYAFPEADVNLTTSESCQDFDNGILDITITTGSGLQFAVDNTSSFTSNLQFDGLAPGIHMLWMTDANNCSKIYSFEIEAVQIPQMTIITQNSCDDINNGTAEIIPLSSGNYQYSLDGITFSPNPQFTNLMMDQYTVYVQDDNSCIHEYNFTIATNPEPDFSLFTIASCLSGSSGTLEIIPLSSGSFEYSLDNISYTSSTIFNDLSVGNGILYVQEIDGCTHTYPFEIFSLPNPEINITTDPSCFDENLGSIYIDQLTSGNYQYSLDLINYTSDLEFHNLSPGQYTINLLEDGECLFQYQCMVNTVPIPALTFESTDACSGESNGSVTVITSEIGLEYSLDQVDYSAE